MCPCARGLSLQWRFGGFAVAVWKVVSAAARGEGFPLSDAFFPPELLPLEAFLFSARLSEKHSTVGSGTVYDAVTCFARAISCLVLSFALI